MADTTKTHTYVKKLLQSINHPQKDNDASINILTDAIDEARRILKSGKLSDAAAHLSKAVREIQ